MIKKIGVIGTGKLGCTMAAVFADKGFETMCFDSNELINECLRKGRAPFDETGLQDLINRCKAKLKVGVEPSDTVSMSDATFVVVETPSEPNGSFSNRYIERAIHDIAEALRNKKGYHLVIIVSTVMPMSHDQVFVPLIEGLTGKTVGSDIGVAYNPEFIAMGSIIEDFKNPSLVLIGESDPQGGTYLEGIYHRVCENDPAVNRTSFINAEMAKLALNCYCTMKISFSNSLAEMCEKVPGADVSIITEVIGQDPRIGQRYLRAGLGFGGPCFPRDNVAFNYFAESLGVDAFLMEAVRQVNPRSVRRVVDVVRKHRPDIGSKVTVLGTAYKPHTALTVESQAIEIARRLAKMGYDVTTFDPMANGNTRAELGDFVFVADNIFSALDHAEIVILAVLWPEFISLDWKDMKKCLAQNPIIIDCWGMWRDDAKNDFQYVALGVGYPGI